MESQRDLGNGLVSALLEVDDLDHLQAVYCSNAVADTAPAVQRVLHDMIQAERNRRTQGDVDALGLPGFADWHPVNLLQAGVLLIAASEAVSMGGNPTLQNFGFRLLQYYFGELAKAHLEHYPCKSD